MAKHRACSYTYYEFFAGSGMVRAGLGDSWKCLFANDFDDKKAASYEQNWGEDEILVKNITIPGILRIPVGGCACEALAA
jgi:DNA (cytosine-5)-methyltransferase 1